MSNVAGTTVDRLHFWRSAVNSCWCGLTDDDGALVQQLVVSGWQLFLDNWPVSAARLQCHHSSAQTRIRTGSESIIFIIYVTISLQFVFAVIFQNLISRTLLMYFLLHDAYARERYMLWICVSPALLTPVLLYGPQKVPLNFTARRYASAVYAVVVMCRPVCLSVCLSITSRHCTKWLNAGSRKQRINDRLSPKCMCLSHHVTSLNFQIKNQIYWTTKGWKPLAWC